MMNARHTLSWLASAFGLTALLNWLLLDHHAPKKAKGVAGWLLQVWVAVLFTFGVLTAMTLGPLIIVSVMVVGLVQPLWWIVKEIPACCRDIKRNWNGYTP